MNILASVQPRPLLPRLMGLPCLLLVLALAFPGCRSVDPGLKSVMSVGYAVDAAMRSAADLHAAGKLSEGDKARILEAHRVWMPVYAAALELSIADRNAAPSPELARRTADLLTAATAAGVVTISRKPP